MTKAERIKAVLHQEKPDRIPWTIPPSYLMLGSAELKFRSQNLSLIVGIPVHRLKRPNVRITDVCKIDEEKRTKTIIRTYVTPKGELTGTYQFRHESSFQTMYAEMITHINVIPPEATWIVEHPFKHSSDYEILEFIIEDSIYEPSYDKFLEVSCFLGTEGIAMALIWKSPFQSLLYEWMGHKRCFLEWYDHPEKFKRLYGIMFEKQKEIYRIAAYSPAELVYAGENITGTITSPKFFEKFCCPFYNEMSDILHHENKVYGVHFDGRLRPLRDLIAKTKIDLIDAFTPPPLGDLPIEKARVTWPNKVISCNFPENVYFMNKHQLKMYTINLLKKIAPGDNFMLTTTENFPVDRWIETFEVLADVLDECGEYPICL